MSRHIGPHTYVVFSKTLPPVRIGETRPLHSNDPILEPSKNTVKVDRANEPRISRYSGALAQKRRLGGQIKFAYKLPRGGVPHFLCRK